MQNLCMRSKLTPVITSDLVSESSENLIGFIASTVEKLRDEVANMREQMATKADLRQVATKEDLARLDGRLSERLEAATTGIRGDIEQVHLGLDGIERAVSSRLHHVEGQLSRLRSAVYVLSKDRPDVLRLLGQNGG